MKTPLNWMTDLQECPVGHDPKHPDFKPLDLPAMREFFFHPEYSPRVDHAQLGLIGSTEAVINVGTIRQLIAAAEGSDTSRPGMKPFLKS